MINRLAIMDDGGKAFKKIEKRTCPSVCKAADAGLNYWATKEDCQISVLTDSMQ